MAIFFNRISTANAPFKTAYLGPKSIGRVAKGTEVLGDFFFLGGGVGWGGWGQVDVGVGKLDVSF